MGMIENFEGWGTSANPGWRFKNLDELEDIKYIVIFWSSWVGKTTIRNYILEITKQWWAVYWPTRAVTRPPRADNTYTNENIHVNQQTMDELVTQWIFAHQWTRTFENDRQESYCFISKEAMDIQIMKDAIAERKDPTTLIFPSNAKSLLILSCNNDFVRSLDDSNSPLHNIKNQTFLLWVFCPDEEKEHRFTTREWAEQISNAEIQKRMFDSSDFAIQNSHVYIENYGEHMQLQKTNHRSAPRNSLEDAVEILRVIFHYKDTVDEINS